jgi:NadR type nicotinamide-nucleotide adenylyltransferase
MTFTKGLIIGKFYPFHKGHQFLVETGLKNCLQLNLILCSAPQEKPFVDLRYEWIKELYPQVKVYILYYNKNDDFNDSKLWADLTVKHLGFTPEVVFTSEDYGELYCQYLKCHHYLVDKAREIVPISGTQIRNQPLKYWDYISNPVREFYAKRIVILGPESTGKTTLSEKLALEFNTIWVPEYRREYSESKLIDKEKIIYQWNTYDFIKIAIQQNINENKMARECNKILICDTNSLAPHVWHLRYLGFESNFVQHYFVDHKQPDLILLMKPDDNTPFVQDGENIRNKMFEDFERILKKHYYSYEILEGSYDSRFKKAKSLIKTLSSDI